MLNVEKISLQVKRNKNHSIVQEIILIENIFRIRNVQLR